MILNITDENWAEVIEDTLTVETFTERQSWMLPDLSVQMKTTNAPQLKIN